MERNDGIEISLRERIKELNCLYGMARLAEQHHNSMEDFLKSLVDFLPKSWRHAEIACSRILFKGETFKSGNYDWSEWRQTAVIRVGDTPEGEVMILYSEERPTADEGPFLKEERDLLEAVAQRISEIAVRLMAVQDLRDNHEVLLLERKALQEANAAIRVVLSHIEGEKKQIYENMQVHIDKVIMPILNALAPAIAQNKRQYIEILKSNLEEITSPYTSRILNQCRTLTPVEINICNMIRNGLRTKEIAVLRGVSTATINRHREHIRRKLNITNRHVNLTTYLQSFSAEEQRHLAAENR